MTKNEFFTSLNSKLSILNEKERKDIIDEYVAHVDFKMHDGKTEEQAVADFGDIDDLAREILDAYHIDNSATQTKNLEYYIKSAVNFIYQATERLLSFSPSDIAKIIVEFFLVLFVTLLMSWPFNILQSTVQYYMQVDFLIPFAGIIVAIVELAKIAVSFLIIYSFIKIRILSRGYHMNNTNENFDCKNGQNQNENSDFTPQAFDTKDSVAQEAAEKPIVENSYSQGYQSNSNPYPKKGKHSKFSYNNKYQEPKPSNGGNFVISLVVNVLKMFLLIAWIPSAIMTITGIVCTVMACVILSVKGIGFLGLCLIGIGCSIMGIAFTAWLGEVIFGGKKNNA